jgi:cytochrome c biogenesis protein CcmG, thiol:disulfide interchange protein DsbE
MKKIFVFIMLATALTAFTQDIKKAKSFRLENTEGKFIELDSLLINGPVLINFWASWCKPCKEELPEIDKISKEFLEKGLKVILITIDKPSFVSKAKAFLKTKGIELELLKDCDMKVIKSFGGGDSVPLTFIIDKEKNIVFKKKGQTTYEELKAEILKIVK